MIISICVLLPPLFLLASSQILLRSKLLQSSRPQRPPVFAFMASTNIQPSWRVLALNAFWTSWHLKTTSSVCINLEESSWTEAAHAFLLALKHPSKLGTSPLIFLRKILTSVPLKTTCRPPTHQTNLSLGPSSHSLPLKHSEASQTNSFRWTVKYQLNYSHNRINRRPLLISQINNPKAMPRLQTKTRSDSDATRRHKWPKRK